MFEEQAKDDDDDNGSIECVDTGNNKYDDSNKEITEKNKNNVGDDTMMMGVSGSEFTVKYNAENEANVNYDDINDTTPGETKPRRDRRSDK